jgi:50S ribosomal subunit-associated GTPase HflX
MISAALPPSRRAARMIIPYAKAELLDELHSHGIISKEDYKEDGVTIEGEFDISFLGKLKKNKII